MCPVVAGTPTIMISSRDYEWTNPFSNDTRVWFRTLQPYRKANGAFTSLRTSKELVKHLCNSTEKLSGKTSIHIHTKGNRFNIIHVLKMKVIKLKKWSGQNRTSRTDSYAYGTRLASSKIATCSYSKRERKCS